MPIKSKKVVYEFNPEELKEIIIKALGDEVKDSDVNIHFHITHQYDAYDRGPGIPVLTSTSVTITRKKDSEVTKS